MSAGAHRRVNPRDRFRASIEVRYSSRVVADALDGVRLALPAATHPRPRHARPVGPTAPICEACGYQHTREVVGARCVDPAACDRRAESWA